MSEHHSQPDSSSPLYRLDRFLVPNSAREVFLARVQSTHEQLAQQPGFVRDYLLEQAKGEASFELVTLVEWQSRQAAENARAQIKASYETLGFNVQAFLAEQGIAAEIGVYHSVPR